MKVHIIKIFGQRRTRAEHANMLRMNPEIRGHCNIVVGRLGGVAIHVGGENSGVGLQMLHKARREDNFRWRVPKDRRGCMARTRKAPLRGITIQIWNWVGNGVLTFTFHVGHFITMRA
jgi:hypothetical protein